MARIKIVAGNWKMNKTAAEAKEFIQSINQKMGHSNAEVVAGVPFVCIPIAVETAKGSNISIAAQNMHWEEKGAFTGEISAKMLKSLDVKYVIIGHSERRQYFAETDQTVNKKLLTAIAEGITPIVCVGESLVEREQNVTEEIIRSQVKIAFLNVNQSDAKNVVIAYEPIWAIGTGKTATNQQANEVCFIIRRTIAELFNSSVAESIRILYGGSVNTSNAKELFDMPDIDGGLIGGASIKLEDFLSIIKAAN